MNKDSKIREAQNRVIDVFKKKPQKALSTQSASATINDGMKCTFTQGELTAVMDMPEIMGGGNAGPTPGFFARAGIAGCLSMGVKQAAVMANVRFDSITVDIETDFDDGASMGLGSAKAGPLETRLTIRVSTSVPKPDVLKLIEEALSRDPWFLALRDVQSVKLDLGVNG